MLLNKCSIVILTLILFLYIILIGDIMKKMIEDYTYNNKKVIIRCDLNVPIKNGIITDDNRITESLKSLNYLIKHDAKIIILSHLGKIKTPEDKKENTLYPVYLKLKDYLATKVYFSPQTRGEELEKMVASLHPGEVLLVENTRYEDVPDKLESSCDDELSRYWAKLGDIFINDAYGTSHRCHASNVGIAKYLPSALGYLVDKEVTKLDIILNENTHPFDIIMGGKKISDKTLFIDHLVKKCDHLLLGGGMCFTFLKASGYKVGLSIVDDDKLTYCKKIMDEYQDKIIMPIDIVTKDNVIKSIDNIDDADVGYDIGPKTIKNFTDILKNAKRVIVNGPMGVFEEANFDKGTKAIYECLKENDIKTLVGGGDSAASVKALGYKDVFFHTSTGGGATLEYLSGNDMPGIDIIDNK